MTPLLGKAVLVADDDEDNAELLAFIVESAGGRACKVTSAGAALEAVASGLSPDAMLLDIGLPDMDGYALLQEIRKTKGLRDIPAVAVSGFAYAKDRHRASEAGFTAHMAKPYDGEALIHLVAKLTSAPPPTRFDSELREALDASGLHGGLALLNSRTSHRFTGVYRFDGSTLRNVALYDRANPTALRGDDAPMQDTYCSIVSESRRPFLTASTLTDARLAFHPARLSVQSYCGVLLRNADSTPLGSLCHFDLVPVEPDPGALDALENAAPLIARLVAA